MPDELMEEASQGGGAGFGRFLAGRFPTYYALVALAGLILMAAGTLLYVSDPLSAYTYLFIAGVAVLLAGYVMLFLGNRSALSDIVAAEEDEDANGFFYILDEDYSAGTGDAVIEDLTRRR